MPPEEISLVQINNPAWIAHLAPDILKLLEKNKFTHMDEHSVIAYFRNSAQFGQGRSEIWVAANTNKPVGFAHWYIAPAYSTPHIATAYLDFVFSKRIGAAKALGEKFLEFAKRNQAVFLSFNVPNRDKLLKYIKKMAKNYNLDLIEQPTIERSFYNISYPMSPYHQQFWSMVKGPLGQVGESMQTGAPLYQVPQMPAAPTAPSAEGLFTGLPMYDIPQIQWSP